MFPFQAAIREEAEMLMKGVQHIAHHVAQHVAQELPSTLSGKATLRTSRRERGFEPK